MQLALSIGLILVSYLSGSLSFAVIVSKLMRLPDPRTYGSKNPGANNVLRSGSKWAAFLTLSLDALKAFIPMAIAQALDKLHGQGDWLIAAVGFAAFLGHLYPVFFKFQGGKGVATALGVLFGVQWTLALLCMVTFVAVAAIWRYSSLASICAAVAAPFMYWLGDGSWWAVSAPFMAVLVTMAVLLVYAHRENLSRLLAGKESKLGARK